MKTELLISTMALSLLLTACVAPLPAPPVRVPLPGNDKAQLPLMLPTARARQRDPIVTLVSMLPAGEIASFDQTRTAGEQKYAQPSATLLLPMGESANFDRARTAGERQTYPAIVATPEAGAVDRYTAMKQLYDAGYRPPNALLAPNQLLISAMARYPILRQIHNLPPVEGSGPVDRYTAMKQLYDAGYRPPNALLDNQP